MTRRWPRSAPASPPSALPPPVRRLPASLSCAPAAPRLTRRSPLTGWRALVSQEVPMKLKTRDATRLPAEINPLNLRADAQVAFDDEAKLELRRQLVMLGEPMLKARLARQIKENRAVYGAAADARRSMPIITRILDTGGTSTGNVLPRVDLEQTITALFVTKFPWWERIAKEPSNGLKHTWNVASATGAATDAQLSASSDLANAQTDVGTYAQDQTVNIAILDTLRGVSLKELYAVEQYGMRYSPETEEMLLGTIRLKSLAQRLIYQGNQSVASKTATTEWGATNANGFDGLRLIV